MQCPICRAENDAGPDCRRCRGDLSLLFELETRRAERMRQARQHAQQGDWRAALRLATEARQMRRGDDATKLIMLSWLMLRQFEKAWRCYKTIRNTT